MNGTTINGVEISGPDAGPNPPLIYVRIGSRGAWHLAATQTRALVELHAATAGLEYVRYCDVNQKLAAALHAYQIARRVDGADHAHAIETAVAAVKTLRQKTPTPDPV